MNRLHNDQVISIVEEAVKNGLVQDFRKLSLDEKEEHEGCSSYVEFNGKLAAYDVLIQIEAYDNGKMWGRVVNLTNPDYTERGSIYLDNYVFTGRA